MYHRIGYPEDTWTRTPESFRSDLEFLVSHGFYPVNLIDVVLGRLDQVPVGRRPVVLTFDDSTAGQFWLRDDGTVDPDCAIGILLEMHRQYGTDWPLHATFFVITPLDQSGSLLFGQTTSGPQKVRQLIEWGMEVGSHTVHHPNLRVVDSDVVQWELAVSQHEIEAMVPGYSVTTLALPEGGTPQDDTLLARGYSEAAGLGYRYLAAVKVGAGPAPSPLSPDFDAYRIPRIRASQDQLDVWFPSMAWSPDRYYVSDGVPRTITGTQ
jgi:peptidoglycan/xylan/chitin deacetylase (PgdA/CDA1 family)